jgi:ATP-dependent Clp protease, protease subunit
MAKDEENNNSKIEDKLEQNMLDARRIFLSDSISTDTANEVIRKLWYLEMKDPGKPILLVINSPGGSIDSGFAIWDQISMITSPVATLVTGLAASMGSILSLAASKGERYATPHSRIMIHQPRLSGIVEGQATDLEIQAREIIKTREMIIKVYMEATGKKHEEIDRSIDRDTWFSAEEAKKFGLIDSIVTSYDEIKT